MILLDLPHELLLLIVEFMEYSWDINSLGRVSRSLHAILNPYLWQNKNQYSRISTLLWSVKHPSSGRRPVAP
ncbi:hypothetical protein BJX63DRAFT_392539 [Aspergillus granulosus]|uniref:F-box domain-containing protein n=1 Tax=Aspergillus granulosus TaxID=176169 RepID=A0ABR4HFI7_9EURO